MQTRFRTGFPFAIVALGALLASCSSNPRVTLLQTSQATTLTLKTVQSAENTVCGLNPTTPTHCTNTVPGVSAATLDAAHAKVEAAIAQFATDKIAFDQQAAAWQPGQGAPTSLVALQADASLLASALQAFGAPTALADAITDVQQVATSIATLVTQFQGK